MQCKHRPLQASTCHSQSFSVVFHGTGNRSGSNKGGHLLSALLQGRSRQKQHLGQQPERLPAGAYNALRTLLLAASYFYLAVWPSQGTQNSTPPSSLYTASSEDGCPHGIGAFFDLHYWTCIRWLIACYILQEVKTGIFIWSAYKWTVYILGLRNIQVNKLMLKHEYLLVNFV